MNKTTADKIPITACLVTAAARDDGNSRVRLALLMADCRKDGVMNFLPCTCDPKCKCTMAEEMDLIRENPEAVLFFRT